MRRTSRRQFLRQTGLGVGALAATRLPPRALAAPLPAADIPPHRALEVPGVYAYADRESVRPGETIAFHISSSVAYRLSVCRLGTELDDPTKDEVLYEFPEGRPAVQPIHPGSYIHVNRPITGTPRALTLECWVRPWKVTGRDGLITQHDGDEDLGFGLYCSDKGAVWFHLATIGSQPGQRMQASAEGVLTAERWHHVVGTWDGQAQTLWVNGAPVGRWPVGPKLLLGSAPLRLAAGGRAGLAADFLDGDLAMPVIYERALGEADIRRRFLESGLQPAGGGDVLACWPLTEERGETVRDISAAGRHGRIVNHATWMIGGPSFHAEVARFGTYDPRQDTRRGHGLRFASDDLYDCRWWPTHRWRVPATARPGMYVGRIRYQWEGKEHVCHVTFIVRRPARRRPAPILVLCATNTWRAYNAAPFGQRQPGLRQVCGTQGWPNAPSDPPAFSLYRAHAGGQGTFQLGLRMPWPAADPYLRYGDRTDYSHLARADRCAQIWLERAGYEFDLATDLDLHRQPDLLRRYRVCLINGHSEYWSLPMYHGLEAYLRGGGQVVVLSGNSLFWRVSFNPEGTILECRKVDAPGDQLPPARRGECWHSHDGMRGGLLRECGYPGWKLIGLDTLGWNNQDEPHNFGPYVAERTDHFLFREPEPTGLSAGERFGWAGRDQVPMANGHEIDVRLSTLAALQETPPPEGAVMPEDPPGLVRLANGIIPWNVGGAAFDYFFRPIKPSTDQGGEMVYWERPEGGRVFNAGSIGAGWALLVDEKFQRLLRNVLHHFGVPPAG